MSKLTSRNARTTGAALALLTGLVAPVALAGPASASGGGGVESRGTCGTTTWKLKAAHDDGRIQVELEVDSNRVGQVWSVRIGDNGTTVFTGTRTTVAPSGSFEVRKLIANRAGADVIRARATHGTTVCAGSVTV